MQSDRKNYATYRDAIAIDYGSLGDGATQAGEICPACSGGSSKEGSLSVTRRGGLLLFNCHRASCTFHGIIDAVGGGGGPTSRRKKRTGYPRIQAQDLNEATVKLLASKYHIPAKVLRGAGLRWSGDEHGPLGRRVCFPINGPDFKERGTSYRSYEEGVIPKAVIELREDDSVASSWYKWLRTSDVLILVEDQMSAIKLAPYVHSLALLGTHMSDTKAAEISAAGYKKVIISLDNDATGTAIKMQIEFRNKIKNLYVSGLGKDIKDMTQGELDEYLQQTL